MTDLSLYHVDLDTLRPNPNDPTKVLRGDAPRTAFTKHNDMLLALHQAVRHVGPIAPSPTTPWMLWLDTGTNPPVEKQRNAENTAWSLHVTPLGLTILGTATSPETLPTDARVGDAYVVGPNIWAWSGTAWVNLGPIVGPQGPQGIPGNDGTSFRVLGIKDTVQDLPQDPEPGDSWIVDGDLYTWNSSSWDFLGPFRGPIGLTGAKGDTGDSAYEEAVKAGFVGTEAEWLASLQGPPGETLDVAVNDQVFQNVKILNIIGVGIEAVFTEDGTLNVTIPFVVAPKQTYNLGDYFAGDYAKG